MKKPTIPTIKQRRNAARRALLAWRWEGAGHGGDDDLTDLSDLLADCLHLAEDLIDLDESIPDRISRLLDTIRSHWEEERDS